MSKPIGIIGAGGYGRELLEYAEDATADGWGYHVEGFFDDDHSSRNGWAGPPLLGTAGELPAVAIEHFVIAVGVPAVRRGWLGWCSLQASSLFLSSTQLPTFRGLPQLEVARSCAPTA